MVFSWIHNPRDTGTVKFLYTHTPVMRSPPDSAISEIVAASLVLVLVVALAVIVAAVIFGIPLLPQNPTLAAFKADTVMGLGSGGTYNVPVITLSQMAGAPLVQDYNVGHHSVINYTRVKLLNPEGKTFTVVNADSMTGKTIEKGETFYIFYYNTGGTESPWIWITNDPSRVFSSTVQPFSPHGNWRVIVTDEKDTNMVIYQQDIRL